MRNAYVVTGTLTDEHTVILDESLPLAPTRARVVVEPFPPAMRRSYQEVMAEIRARQKARGHQPRTREEVDAYLQAERDSWGERPCVSTLMPLPSFTRLSRSRLMPRR